MVSLPEGATVYGNLGVFATEILMAIAFVLRGRPIVRPEFKQIVRALFVVFAVSFVCLGWSRLYAVSLGWVSHLVAAGMFLLLLLDERTKISHSINTFLVGLILPCILGWIQYLTGFSPALTLLGLAQKQVETSGVAVVATDAFRSLRAYGSFPHPNIFGGYLAIGIVLKGWKGRKGLKSMKSWEGWLQITMIVLFTSTLILTFSRGAWLALTIGLVVFLGQAFYDKKLVPHRAIPLLSVGLITILLSIGMLHSHVLARFNPALRVEAISLEERASQYQTFGSVFKIDPLFGVGPGAYVFALQSLSKGQPVWSYQPIHNTPLLLLAEFGIIGFLAFGYFVFEILRLVFVHKKTSGGIFASTLLLMLLILSLFDHYPLSMWPGIALMTFVLAISLRLPNTS
jgi:O-antigen ligase